MRNKVLRYTIICFIMLLSVSANADSVVVLGDINGDNRISLEEAVYALQITAGLKSPVIYYCYNQTPETAKEFIENFESGQIKSDIWGKESVQPDDLIQTVTYPVRKGNYAVRFTIRPGDSIYGGNRCEITYDNHDPVCSEVFYAWSFMLDPQYEESEWQTLGQWHDQPDTSIGETWENFESHNAPVAVGYSNGELYVDINPPLPRGGQPLKQSSRKKISRGEWIDLIFHIKWSPGSDGFVEVWINGEHLTPYNGTDYKMYGQTIFNKAGNYLKIGILRDPDSTSVCNVYFDEVKIGNSYSDVTVSK